MDVVSRMAVLHLHKISSPKKGHLETTAQPSLRAAAKGFLSLDSNYLYRYLCIALDRSKLPDERYIRTYLTQVTKKSSARYLGSQSEKGVSFPFFPAFESHLPKARHAVRGSLSVGKDLKIV